MARADVNPSHFAVGHSNLPHIGSPLPKRSRLSLRRTTTLLHKPCYKEDDIWEPPRQDSPSQPKAPSPTTEDKDSVEMIDLTQDENTSPNCIQSPSEQKILKQSEESEEESKTRVWCLGLPNCGNTCYVNSILQVLRYTPNFLQSLHSLLLIHYQLSKVSILEDDSKEVNFFKSIHMLYSTMKRKEALMKINVEKDYSNYLMKPVQSVINSLREVSVLFEEGEQHDAHELLITAISAFSAAYLSLKNQLTMVEEEPETKELNIATTSDTNVETAVEICSGQETKKQIWLPKRRKSKNINFDFSLIENIHCGFDGKIRHIVQCLECEKRLEREESFANLEVNIPENIVSEGKDTVNLVDCLSQITMLSGENKFFCEDCLRLNEARMSSEVVKMPSILLLHFSWLGRSWELTTVEKTSIKVDIPCLLNTSEHKELFCCSPDQSYKLFAVVLHIGQSTEGGHYVSFIRDVSQEADTSDEDCENKTLRPKLRPSAHFTAEPEHCCITDEIVNITSDDASTKWLLFDDSNVSPVCLGEVSETFPYFNYLSVTASPCMIFYRKI